MKNITLLLLLSVSGVIGQTTHQFSPNGPLTGSSGKAARDIGLDFLQSAASGVAVDAPGISGTYLAREYKTAHNGVSHLIFRQ